MDSSKIKEIIYYSDRIANLSEKQKSAASIPDRLYLYSLVLKYKPKVVLEIGTWVGTTTWVIWKGMIDSGYQGVIYTCDIHNMFDYWDKKACRIIKYKCCKSTKMIKNLLRKNIKIDFCFADAGLLGGDSKELRKLYRDKILFATHDYKLPDKKGVRNIKQLKKVCGNCMVTTPKPFKIDGNQINSSVALLEEK